MSTKLFWMVLWLSFWHGGVGLAELTWQETKGDHFIVYAQKRSAFSNLVLRKAEDTYQAIVRYFGNLPKKDFWSWENRCKIYLYRSRADYIANTRQPEWSGGFADIRNRAIVSFANAPDFLESVLPHEMAHLIFREFVDVGNSQVPRWLDEGFAIAQESVIRTSLDETVRKAVQRNEFISIRQLNSMSALHTQPTESARLFYAQAQSITRYMLDGANASNFLGFCRLLRDGVDFEDALRRSYKREFETVEALEKKWKRHVNRSR